MTESVTRDLRAPSRKDGGKVLELPWQQLIPVDRLHANPDNPRTDFGDLPGLAGSVRRDGQKQQVLVYPAPVPCPAVDDDGIPCGSSEQHFYIEDGERRWRALRSGTTEILCVVHPVRAGENIHVRNLLTALITDTHRKNLTPVARAKAYRRLMTEARLNQSQVAARIGCSVSSVSNALALLELAPNIRKQVEEGKLSQADALAFVHRRRIAVRQKEGSSGLTGATGTWEPELFTVHHQLARRAEGLCDARGHNNRRRRVKSKGFAGACDGCWSDVIREDQRVIDTATRAAAYKWQLPPELQARLDAVCARPALQKSPGLIRSIRVLVQDALAYSPALPDNGSGVQAVVAEQSAQA